MATKERPIFHKMKKAAWRSGNTRCHWCAREMYFARLEQKETAKARLGVISLKQLRLLKATIEHLIPRSRGGPDAKWNLVLACNECNSKRGSPTLSNDACRSIMLGYIGRTE